jgi:hypothetical protein
MTASYPTPASFSAAQASPHGRMQMIEICIALMM